MLHHNHLYYDMTRLLFLMLAAEFSQNKSNAYFHGARFSLLTLLTLGQKYRAMKLYKRAIRNTYLKDALSVCRLTNLFDDRMPRFLVFCLFVF